jgi:hypothetical protein
MKISALLVPKEFKVEDFGGVASLSDEELDQAITEGPEAGIQPIRQAAIGAPIRPFPGRCAHK